MGAALGLLFGIGALLVATSGRPRRAGLEPTRRQRRQELLVQAGVSGVTPGALVCLQVTLAGLAFLLVLVVSSTLPVAVAFAGFGWYGPLALVKRRRLARSRELRDVWPELVDNLASGVRAGLSLPEALAALGNRGPEALRAPFRAFADDYRATGRFAESLDQLKDRLADPVGDRVVESLRMAREVGGTDLGRLLRTLSAFLREEARVRAELQTRQGWTINAARLAVGAPWVVLLLLATQSATVTAYNSATGAVVLAAGGAVCSVAYRLMLRIGRLPADQRVLR